MTARVVAVARDKSHHFSKKLVHTIELLAGRGVRSDAHEGSTVKHRSRVKIDPTQPNLRQVHLLHSELFDELASQGFNVHPADLGENITTSDIDLLALPRGTLLMIGENAVIEVTGLRNPCSQIERFKPGLLSAVAKRETGNKLIRKAGIMAIVRIGGTVRPNDQIEVHLPQLPHLPLECV